MNGLSHASSNLVTLDQLRQLPTPPSLGRFHRPVPHHELMEEVNAGLLRQGVAVLDHQMAVSKDGAKLFGVLQLDADHKSPPVSPSEEGRGMALGIRSANDQSFRIEMVVGQTVFVCDNMCFSGDILALSRKHTIGVQLAEEIDKGLDRYFSQAEVLKAQIAQLEETHMPMYLAKEVIFDAVIESALPARFMRPVASNFFHPEDAWTDCHPNTAWGLHNAFTRAIRSEPLRPRMKISAAIGRLFRLSASSN